MNHGLISYLRQVQELEGHLYTFARLTDQVKLARDEVSLEAQQVECYSYGQPIPAEDDPIRRPVKVIRKNQQDMNRMVVTGSGRVFNSVLPSAAGEYKIPIKAPEAQHTYETGFGGHFKGTFLFLAAVSLIGAIVTTVKQELFFRQSVKCLLLYLAASVAVSVVSYFLLRPMYRRSAKRRFDYLDGIYRKALEERNQALEPEHAYLRQCQAEIDALEHKAALIRKKLDVLYGQEVIHRKYRNLVAVSQMLEYLESGRCEGLTGPTGAYNLFEDELRKNMIITQLQQINARLESLEKFQFVLYGTIRQATIYCDQLRRELEAMTFQNFHTPKILQEVGEKVEQSLNRV